MTILNFEIYRLYLLTTLLKTKHIVIGYSFNIIIYNHFDCSKCNARR